MQRLGVASVGNNPSTRLIDVLGISPRPRAVAIGVFDGVHIGHEEVVAGCDTALTFDPHPLSVLAPQRAPRLLTDLVHRRRRLAALGVREIVVIPFDQEWSALDAAAFIDELIVRRLCAFSVSVGANFRFGAGGRGDATMLGGDPRFHTKISPLVTFGSAVVSSSRIRELIADGDVEQAAALLGRWYTLPARTLPRRGLAVDRRLATPRPGRYLAVVQGRTTTVTVRDDGVLQPGRTQIARSVEVMFVKNLG